MNAENGGAMFTESMMAAHSERYGVRHELVDGGRYFTPAPTPLHQLVSGRLCALLAEHAPPGLDAVYSIAVECDPETVVLPDVALVPTKVIFEGGAVVRADQLVLVAEIASLSSARMDRALRSVVYAEAGISDYLLVELDPPTITWFRRSGPGSYGVQAVAHGDEALVLDGQVGVEIVPAALVAPRG